MAKSEWGLKRVCIGCGARYYDMRKTPPVCPACGATFDPEQVLKTRRRSVPEDKNRKPQAVADQPVDELDDIVPTEGDADDSVIEDAEELGDEDSDLEEVVELEDDDDRNDTEQ